MLPEAAILLGVLVWHVAIGAAVTAHDATRPMARWDSVAEIIVEEMEEP